MTPLNPREHAPPHRMETLMHRYQQDASYEQSFQMPGGKVDMVRKRPSEHDPDKTEHAGQQCHHDVYGEFVDPNLRYCFAGNV